MALLERWLTLRRRTDRLVDGMMVSAVFRSGVVCTQCSGSLLKSFGRLGIGTIPGCKELLHCPTRASIAKKMLGKNLMMVSVAYHVRKCKDNPYSIVGRNQQKACEREATDVSSSRRRNSLNSGDASPSTPRMRYTSSRENTRHRR